MKNKTTIDKNLKKEATTTDKNFKKETSGGSSSWDQKKQQGGFKTPQRDTGLNAGHKISGTSDIKSRPERH